MTYLALDLGTTSIKGAVLDSDRLRIEHLHSVPFPAPLPGLPPLWCEVDPAAILSAARQVLDALAPHAPRCAGLLVCGQMGGLILSTEAGQPLSNYISWRDQRLLEHPSGSALTYFDALAERLGPEILRELGREVRPGTTLGTLFWLAQTGQLTQDAIAATLPDFVAAHLCGARPAVDPSLVPGALEAATRAWHDRAFERLGLDGVRRPHLADYRAVLGHFDCAGQRVPCYAPTGDQPTALAGALLAEGELSLNLSTGSQVSVLSPRLALGDYQTRPYFDGQYLNTLTNIPAGRALNLLLDLLGELPAAQGRPLDDPWPYVRQAVAAVPATDLRADLAFFPGPVGERGSLANLHQGNLTLGHLFRAAFENMADNYLACARRLWPAQGWHTLVFSGGLAHKLPELRALIAARLGGQVRVEASTEETLVGLLALALVASGRAQSVQAATGLLRLTPNLIGDSDP